MDSIPIGLGKLMDRNFLTVGLIDGVFRANLEETGMGYDKEVALIATARHMDLLTTPYVFDVDEARLMTEAGVDIIVAHMGLTTSGTIGAKTAKPWSNLPKKYRKLSIPARACVMTFWCYATADRLLSPTM